MPRGVTLVMQSVVMQLDGLFGIFWFFLLLLIGVLIALFAMAIGGIIVAGLSLPALFVLPTVRHPLVTFAESIRDVRIESIVSLRFVGVYLLFIYAYGVSLIFFTAWLAESMGTIQVLVFSWQSDLLAALVATVTIGVGTFLLAVELGLKNGFALSSSG